MKSHSIGRRGTETLLRAVFGGILILCGSAPSIAAEPYSSYGDSRLKGFIRQALDRNPLLQQSLAGYRASLQRLPQVGQLPDPVLSITQYARRPETRVGPQTTMVSVSQRFPWLGKLKDREQVSMQRSMELREQHRAQEAELVRKVKAAYYSLAHLDRVIEIAQEDETTLEHYETLAQARYARGSGSLQGVVKLQAQITRAQHRLQLLQSQRVDVEAELNGLLDRPADTPVESISLPAPPSHTFDMKKLLQLGRLSRPEVQAARHRIEAGKRRIELAKKGFRPDVSLGASFVNVLGRSDPAGRLRPPDQNGKNIYGLTLGINLPIRRRRHDAAVLEATEATISSRRAYDGLIRQVEVSIRALRFRIQTLREQIDLFERTLLPQAEQVRLSTEEAYATGRLGVLDLLDSERDLFQLRIGLAGLMSDTMKSLADMERAVGVPYREVNQ
jgi:outer membrane protein TolC